MKSDQERLREYYPKEEDPLRVAFRDNDREVILIRLCKMVLDFAPEGMVHDVTDSRYLDTVVNALNKIVVGLMNDTFGYCADNVTREEVLRALPLRIEQDKQKNGTSK